MAEHKLIAATKELGPKKTRGHWNLTRKRYIALHGELAFEGAKKKYVIIIIIIIIIIITTTIMDMLPLRNRCWGIKLVRQNVSVRQNYGQGHYFVWQLRIATYATPFILLPKLTHPTNHTQCRPDGE